jgi:hypothetical protein
MSPLAGPMPHWNRPVEANNPARSAARRIVLPAGRAHSGGGSSDGFEFCSRNRRLCAHLGSLIVPFHFCAEHLLKASRDCALVRRLPVSRVSANRRCTSGLTCQCGGFDHKGPGVRMGQPSVSSWSKMFSISCRLRPHRAAMARRSPVSGSDPSGQERGRADPCAGRGDRRHPPVSLPAERVSGHCAQRQILKADVCDGSKADINCRRLMSALPPKADIVRRGGNVRFVPIADSCTAAKSDAQLPLWQQ